MTIRILFVIPGFEAGGAQRQCIRLINAIASDSSFDLHLCFFRRGVYWDELSKQNVTLHESRPCSMATIEAFSHVHSTIRKLRPSIVFSWLHGADILTGVCKLALPKIRWIMAERDSTYPSQLKYTARQILGKLSDHICANSPPGAAYWTNSGIPRSKVTVHNNIVNPTKELHTAKDKYSFVYAGRLERQKNIQKTVSVIMRAIELTKSSACIIGSGTLKETVSKQIRSHSKSEYVDLREFRPDLSGLYNSEAAFISLSLHEGQPNIVLECILYNRPIVLSNIPEHVALVGPSYPFLVSQDFTTEQIAMTLIRAAKLDMKTTSIYEYARIKISEMNPENVAKSYVEVFRSLTNEEN